MVAAPLALALLLQSPPPRPAPQRPGLSWEDADSLSRKLDSLDKHPAAPRPRSPGALSVTEKELNSYLNLSLGAQMPPGLSELDVRLDADRIGASAQVDVDQMKRRMPPTGLLNPLSYLGGRVPVELRARLQNPQDGFASLEFELIRLGPVTLPPSLLAQWVASFTRSADSPQGFDILSPFRLPYAVRRVRIQPGRASLEF